MTTKQIQALLTYLGYEPGEVDGLRGKNTRRAVLAFQAQEGLEADGSPGPKTQAALLEAVACGRCRQAQTSGAQTVPEWWADIRYFKQTDSGIACPCGRCGGCPVEPAERLMRLADKVREHFDAPMIPTSTVRCQAHNDSLKGSAKNSYHILGKAMDFYIPGRTAAEVVAYVKTLGVHYTYAIDEKAVHMDVN